MSIPATALALGIIRFTLRVLPLREYELPDVADHLVHFTGRLGLRLGNYVGTEILYATPEQKLLRILVEGGIQAFETFGSEAPVVCFTESTKSAVTKLIEERRYVPCGVAFTKQFVFDRHGGPALYVRGDEWPHASELPQPLRSRIVRFWPGAERERRGELLHT